jgi:hypothetical protein
MPESLNSWLWLGKIKTMTEKPGKGVVWQLSTEFKTHLKTGETPREMCVAKSR